MPVIDFPNIASDTPLWLALLTTFIAAMSGALRGRDPGRVRYDIIGILVFAFCLGVGGGVTRDLLLGNTPPVVLREPAYVVAVLAATVLVLATGIATPRVERPATVKLTIELPGTAKIHHAAKASALRGI